MQALLSRSLFRPIISSSFKFVPSHRHFSTMELKDLSKAHLITLEKETIIDKEWIKENYPQCNGVVANLNKE